MLTAAQLSKLREVMQNELGLEIEDESLTQAGIAIARFVAGKELRKAELSKLKKG